MSSVPQKVDKLNLFLSLLTENVCILIKISLKFVPEGSNNDIPALV